MQQVADAEGAGIKIEAWDYRHYAEKVRKAKYDLDDAEVKPYLQMEKIREGIFWASKQLFDFNWTEFPACLWCGPKSASGRSAVRMVT